MKQLTKIETQQIFDFIKKRRLKYYDIQIEIVDHFASAIEANWERYPTAWSFEQKILSVYNELGDKRFRSIVRGKSKMVFRQAYKSAFEYVKSAVKIPQIFLTILLIYCLQQVFMLTERPWQIFGFIFFMPQLILLFYAIWFLFYYYLSFKRKIYVFEQSFSLLVTWTLIPNISIAFFNLWPDYPCSPEMYLLISTILILYTIFCLGSLMVIWKILRMSKDKFEHLSNT